MRIALVMFLLCTVAHAEKAAPVTKPTSVDEVTRLKIRLSLAEISNLEQQITLAEVQVREGRVALEKKKKDHAALVEKVRKDFSMTEADGVNLDKGDIVRAKKP